MSASKRRFFVLVLGLLVLGACIQTSSEPEIVATRLVRPATATPIPEKVPPPPRFDLGRGAELFASSCAACHGAQGLGDGQTASAFACEMPKLALAAPDTDLNAWHAITSNGNQGDVTCLMPPWSGRLDPEEIWQVVAYASQLRYQPDAVARGQVLLAQAAIGDTPDYLRQTTWYVETTDAELDQALSENRLEGYSFPSPPSAAERADLIAALRSVIFSTGGEVAQASTPAAPIATEEAISPAQPNSTEEAVPPVSETFSVNGRVINGTAGALLPPTLPLILRIVGFDANGQPTELYRANGTMNVDGSFNFSDIPRFERAVIAIETDYAGVRQFSPQVVPAHEEGVNTLDITLTVYETTKDSAVLQIDYVETLIDAVTEEDASLIFQSYEIQNTSDRLYVGENGRTVRLPLPAEAVNPSVPADIGGLGRFQVVQEEGRFVLYDQQNVPPGRAGRISLQFNTAYTGDLTLSQTFAYDVARLGVYVSRTRGLELESEQLTEIQGGELNGVVYAGYGLAEGQTLPAGQPLTYRILDGEPLLLEEETASENNEGLAAFVRENSTLLLGLGALCLVAAGMFMVYDLQKRRLTLQAQSAQTRQDLIAQIAALDEAFEEAQISAETYEKERQALKERLRQTLS